MRWWKNKMTSHVKQYNNVYSINGAVTPTCSDWEFIPSEDNGGMTYNPAEGYYPDKGGKLMGPKIDCEEFHYYMLSFDAECQEDCHWAVFFYDAEGKVIVSDVYSSIYKDQKEYQVVIYSRENAASMQPFFQFLKDLTISNLTIEKISIQDTALWSDELYETLQPLSYQAPSSAMNYLPATAEALQSGIPWRVVMLGDSIINDIFNSNFQALIKRSKPSSNFKWICSVRGGTGCWYYQEPENFQEYVIDLKPDLLIIGGISQSSNIEAVEKVIGMAQKQLNCEIMLLSGPFGHKGELVKFTKKLQKLAVKMHIEFMDCRKVWADYIGKTDIPMEYFYRDHVHANDRGKQIIGRAMNNFFST